MQNYLTNILLQSLLSFYMLFLEFISQLLEHLQLFDSKPHFLNFLANHHGTSYVKARLSTHLSKLNISRREFD